MGIEPTTSGLKVAAANISDHGKPALTCRNAVRPSPTPPVSDPLLPPVEARLGLAASRLNELVRRLSPLFVHPMITAAVVSAEGARRAAPWMAPGTTGVAIPRAMDGPVEFISGTFRE